MGSFASLATPQRTRSNKISRRKKKGQIVSNLKPTLLRAITLIGFALASFYGVSAQSSIFNVPSTDVMPPHMLYVEADYIAHPASYENGGFQYFGPSIIYGLRKNLEIGLNIYVTRSDEPGTAELQPNVKWQFYNDESKGIAAAVGGMLFVPLTHRAGFNPKAMVYATVSKQIKKKFGPRVTSGAYSFIGRMADGETRSGMLLGFEQPLHRKLSFVADWYTGHNSYGYAAAGLGLTLPKKNALYVGYSFGNKGRGNNWLGIFCGHTF
jgi:hypothetical protein